MTAPARSFTDDVARARARVIDLAQAPPNPNHIQPLIQFLADAASRFEQYISEIARSVKLIEDGSEGGEGEKMIFLRGEAFFQADKTCLYVWQVINYVTIHSEELEPKTLSFVSELLPAVLQYEPVFAPATIKHALIVIHNIAAKALKSETAQIDSLLPQWMEAVLAYHFQRTHNTILKIAHQFKFAKPEAVLIEETEWIAYLFNQIFSSKLYSSREHSFLELLDGKAQDGKAGYYALHMVGNFFQDMIDKRVTTELVSGFECQIKDVRQMYDSKGRSLIQLTISRVDLAWVCRKFNATMDNYRRIASQYIATQFEHPQTPQTTLLGEWKAVTDYLQEFCHVLNCVLFIGGYNSCLQNFIIVLLLEGSRSLLDYFELSYLLYRNIESTKHQTKVSLMVEMEREAKRKLLSQAGVEVISIDEVNIKSLKLERVMADGQLVGVMRLLANLVHINHRAQLPFEDEPRYLHMILSLTHDSVTQATMKQWAILFIRNVSEWSQKLRDQISAVQVQMKIE